MKSYSAWKINKEEWQIILDGIASLALEHNEDNCYPKKERCERVRKSLVS